MTWIDLLKLIFSIALSVVLGLLVIVQIIDWWQNRYKDPFKPEKH